ncbi:MAG: hypothetical protein ACO3ST_01240 [Burkholderiaceae bacterium]
MSQARAYLLWAALAVEIYRQALDRRPSLARVTWLAKLMDGLMSHWIEWRTEKLLKDVDRQAQELQEKWAEEDRQAQRPVLTELPPDGSKAQDLLGGEMRLQAPWVGRSVGYDRDEEPD